VFSSVVAVCVRPDDTRPNLQDSCSLASVDVFDNCPPTSLYDAKTHERPGSFGSMPPEQSRTIIERKIVLTFRYLASYHGENNKSKNG